MGIAKATTPNVCKMPGPPAPFVPSPLPNIAKSGMSPKGYSKKVKIEGDTVAIRGATFKSMGDIASKATGGGLISANTHGPAKFITPGSLTVKIERKSVHLLGEPMLNNCGASGMPPNTGATLAGVSQAKQGGRRPIIIDCTKDDKGAPFDKCEQEEICAKCASINQAAMSRKGRTGLRKRRKTRKWAADKEAAMRKRVAYACREMKPPSPPDLGFAATSDYCKNKLKKKAEENNYNDFSPDHKHDWTLGGHPSNEGNLRWMSRRTNSWMGSKMQNFKTAGPDKNTGVKGTCCP